jgi:hypothetical protein
MVSGYDFPLNHIKLIDWMLVDIPLNPMMFHYIHLYPDDIPLLSDLDMALSTYPIVNTPVYPLLN